jgi:hypothetical protein
VRVGRRDDGDDLGLGSLSDDELLAWGESLRSLGEDASNLPEPAARTARRPRRPEPLRAAPLASVAAPPPPPPPPPVVAPAPAPAPRRRTIRGRPLMAGGATS